MPIFTYLANLGMGGGGASVVTPPANNAAPGGAGRHSPRDNMRPYSSPQSRRKPQRTAPKIYDDDILMIIAILEQEGIL